jgi:hypothetical protein
MQVMPCSGLGAAVLMPAPIRWSIRADPPGHQYSHVINVQEVPDHPRALWRRAAVRAFLGQLHEAEEDYRLVVRFGVVIQCCLREAALLRVQRPQYRQFLVDPAHSAPMPRMLRHSAGAWRPSLPVGVASPAHVRTPAKLNARGGLVGCRRVAEVDPSLAADVDRELARMRQKDAAAERRQKKQWKGAICR